MSKSITPAKIHATAERLEAEGTRPTLAAVRQALGGGSFTTISEAMKTWRTQVQEEHELALVQVPAALDERMEQLKRAAWEVAQQEAENRLKSDREALAAQRQALDAKLAEAHQVVEVLEREAEARELSLAELKSERDQLAEALAKTSAEAEHLAKEVAGLKKEKKAKTQALQDQVEELKKEKLEFRELENRLRSENQKQLSQLARADVFENLFAEEQQKRESLEKELAKLRAEARVVVGDGQPKP